MDEKFHQCGHCHGNFKESVLIRDLTDGHHLGWICQFCWDEYMEGTRKEPDCPECQHELRFCTCEKEDSHDNDQE